MAVIKLWHCNVFIVELSLSHTHTHTHTCIHTHTHTHTHTRTHAHTHTHTHTHTQGVTIPSQRRYVQYYGHLIRNQLNYSPRTVLLKGIRLEGVPQFGQSGCSKSTIISLEMIYLCSWSGVTVCSYLSPLPLPLSPRPLLHHPAVQDENLHIKSVREHPSSGHICRA